MGKGEVPAPEVSSTELFDRCLLHYCVLDVVWVLGPSLKLLTAREELVSAEEVSTQGNMKTGLHLCVLTSRK